MLVFKRDDKGKVDKFLKTIGGVQELPFIQEDKLKPLLAKAVAAIECGNSLWKSKKMPDYAAEFSAQKRLNGKLGLKKTAVLPTH